MMFKHFLTASVFVASMIAAGSVTAADKKAEPVVAAVKATPFPDPVARVNGIAIPAADLQKALNAFHRSPGGHQVPQGKEKEVQQFILNQMIAGELMFQIAQKTTIKDLDKKVDESFNKLKSRFKTEDDFKKGLQEQGIDQKGLKNLVRRNLIIENYIEQTIVPGQKVTDAEVKDFYDKNPDTFTRPEQIRASHILITLDPKASEADKKKAREKIEGLLKQIKAGADFAKLAQENSGCPSSKQGGDLGYFGKGQMVKQFDDAVFVMKPGELSGVVETQFGFHIIKLTEKRAAGKIPFDEVKSRIAESLKHKKVSEAINSTLELAKKNGKVEIFLK